MEKKTVLLIEDDPMVREVNRQFIERVEGFEIIEMARNGLDGIEKIKELQPHLVLLDIYMPELDGMEALRLIRQQNLLVDVIAVTAADDLQTIQKMMHLGLFDYIMKPFTFERMEQTLLKYRTYKEQVAGIDHLTQKEFDDLMQQGQAKEIPQTITRHEEHELPKGFNRTTLDKVLNFLKETKSGASADEVAAGIGVARVTARRYLDFMEKRNLIKVDVQYGSIGRPINQYFI
ncbi:response regulator [Solibacillus sp. CAU 1738]|uniref:response regulator n=1 Tax=Solibacillus sp. CAU 1738 TaxID=3140363 RepID=UPI003260537D